MEEIIKELEYKLANPLDLEEKLELPRLIGHDSIGVSNILMSKIHGVIEGGKVPASNLKSYVGLINNIQLSVFLLSQHDEFRFSDSISNQYMDNKKLKGLFGKLKLSNKIKLEVAYESIKPFLTENNILTSVLFNLVKNANSHCYDRLSMNVKKHEGFPKHTVFIPEGAEEYNDFISFEVCNDGLGFDEKIPLKDYFTKTPEKGSRGFGLFYTKLASKVLRAPVNIESRAGDTKVSFYHPIYVR